MAKYVQEDFHVSEEKSMIVYFLPSSAMDLTAQLARTSDLIGTSLVFLFVQVKTKQYRKSITIFCSVLFFE